MESPTYMPNRRLPHQAETLQQQGAPPWLASQARLRGHGSSLGPLGRLACARRAQRCTGFPMGHPFNFSQAMWRALREVDLVSVTTQFSQSYARQDPSIFKLHHLITPHIDAAVRDCAGGVVTGLVYGLSDISQTLGDGYALQAFKLAMLVYWSLRACGGSDWEITVPGAVGTRFAPNVLALPRIFGLERRKCGEGEPRVYIQDVGLAEQAVRCSTGLRFTETWFHRQLLYSECSVNQERADFVFIPLYSMCEHYRRQKWTELQDHAYRFPFIRPYFELAERYGEILEELRRQNPGSALENYLLFFPEEKWPMFGMGDFTRPRPRLLVVEARPVHCTHYDRVRSNELLPRRGAPHPMYWRCFHCRSCFRPGYDIVVPSVVDYYTRSLLMLRGLAYLDRQFLAVWHGNGGPDSNDGAYCEVVNWRWRMESLMDLAGVVIGGHHERYEHILGDSRFCLVPKGLGYWTHRLYEVILAGCIPVILSDHVVLPFQGVAGIHWPDFSVKWPEELINIDLYKWLLYVDAHRGPQMKAALDKVACWFDYHGEGECNAVNAALKALSQPAEPELPPFWNSPTFPARTPDGQFQRWIRERAEATNTSETPPMQVFKERIEGSQHYGGMLV